MKISSRRRPPASAERGHRLLGLETSAQPEQDLARCWDRNFAPDRVGMHERRMLDGGAETLVEAGRVLDGEFLFLPTVRCDRPLGSMSSNDLCVHAGQIQLVLTLRGFSPDQRRAASR